METNLTITNNSALLGELKQIIEQGRREAYAAASVSVLKTYWNIGKRIVEELQEGETRAKYGTQLLKNIATELTREYGKGFTKRDLDYYKQFYLSFKDLAIAYTRVRNSKNDTKPIVNTRVHNSENDFPIWYSRVPNLTWSHFKVIMREATPEGRAWYIKEASEQMWSVRTLERNVMTQYYGRMLSSQRNTLELPKPEIETEDPLDYIKSPIIAEFMGFKRDAAFTETQLEEALISNLEKFILELGRGFAFVERQQHIATETDDFYIDLVFYNFKLKRFVIFELKTHKLTHQDIGQLDMYVRMYDDMMKADDDKPTIGVLLCTDTDSTIARYSVLNDNENLFASKYMAYMPTEEELRHEIEQQKRYFLESHEK